MIKNIYDKDKQIALIIKNGYSNQGVNFFTKDESTQQIAFMNHEKGTRISAHIHNQIQRIVVGTPEVLIIKEGKLRLDLYSQEQEYIESTILETGDIVFLPYGGHGIKCLEDCKYIEVKQGPYLGINDKERFADVKEEKVIIND